MLTPDYQSVVVTHPKVDAARKEVGGDEHAQICAGGRESAGCTLSPAPPSPGKARVTAGSTAAHARKACILRIVALRLSCVCAAEMLAAGNPLARSESVRFSAAATSLQKTIAW